MRTSTPRFRSSVLCLLLVASCAALLVPPTREATAATLILNSATDAVDAAPGDGSCLSAGGACTLRAAIQEANALPGPDRIEMGIGGASPLFSLAIAGAGEDAGATGDLDITDDLEIDFDADPGSSIVRLGQIDAGTLDRAFDVHAPAIVSVRNTEVLGGRAPAGENGGSLRNTGTLTVSSLYLRAGSAPSGDGGNVFNAGSMSITSGLNDDGSAPSGRGGAIANTGTLELSSGTIRRGIALTGGGIFNAGQLGALRTPIGNCQATAGAGGGVWNEPGATAGLSNLSLGGNSAASGAGGLANFGVADLHNLTVAENGTGLHNDDGGGASTTIENSILADACTGTIGSGGYNISASCALTGDPTGNQIGVDPEISPLICNARDYYTTSSCPYFLPERGSPAINAGDPAGCYDHNGVRSNRDQRSVFYPVGRSCDVGAGIAIAACEDGRPLKSAKLVVTGLGQAPGLQRVRLDATSAMNPSERFLSPPHYGAQILVEDLGTGAAWIDRWHGTVPIVPGFLYSSCRDNRRTGEKKYTYKEKGGPSCPTLPGGRITLFESVDRLDSQRNDVKMKIRTQGAAIGEPVGPIQVSVTYGFSVVHSANGRYGTCAKHVIDLSGCERKGSQLICEFP